MPWCTTRDLDPQLSCTRGFEVPHEHFQTHSAQVCEQGRLGKRKWHTESGYSKRSKVETTFHRYKNIVGSAMRARGLAAQRVEARIGCKILNTMTALGMPDSEMIG